MNDDDGFERLRDPRRPRRVRDFRVQRAKVFLPNGFTLANLFFGIFAIILASRSSFDSAVLCVLLGGLADVLDGRVARATGTGSRFGEELDSLVDAISFGLAPALIMYFAVLSTENWDWLLVFVYSSCAVMRLARFNIEQAGRAKTHFRGLPSPAAGITLASYWWFRGTPLYQQRVVFFSNRTIAELPWNGIIPALMLLLSFLMLSDVPYPAVPIVGWRTTRQRIGSLVVAGCIAGIFIPKPFIFPALILYVLLPLLGSVAAGFQQRRGTEAGMFMEEEPDQERSPELSIDEPEIVPEHRSVSSPNRPSVVDDRRPGRRKRRRRRPPPGRSSGGPPDSTPPTPPSPAA